MKEKRTGAKQKPSDYTSGG